MRNIFRRALFVEFTAASLTNKRRRRIFIKKTRMHEWKSGEEEKIIKETKENDAIDSENLFLHKQHKKQHV